MDTPSERMGLHQFRQYEEIHYWISCAAASQQYMYSSIVLKSGGIHIKQQKKDMHMQKKSNYDDQLCMEPRWHKSLIFKDYYTSYDPSDKQFFARKPTKMLQNREEDYDGNKISNTIKVFIKRYKRILIDKKDEAEQYLNLL